MTLEQLRKPKNDYSDTQALVVGFAREGTALARYLVERGARVTITDLKSAGQLADSLASLAGLPVQYVLGGHPEALLDSTDIVFVSPGVPLQMPLLVEARRRGLPLSSETRVFTRACPALVAGITGSSGKSTTTALVGAMLEGAGCRVWVGGNIGRPLIPHLVEIGTADLVVMELSSFQLDFFGPWERPADDQHTPQRGSLLFDPTGWSPPIAAVLNITPNHLDRHGTMEAYVGAKAHILAHQSSSGVSVLNFDDPVTREMGQSGAYPAQGRLWFSLEQEVTEGAFLAQEELLLRWGDQEQTLCHRQDLRLMGRHNLANALAACALVAAISHVRTREGGLPALDVETVRRVLTTFSGVEHRLELVRTRGNVRWYNDSIATSPERTIAALRSFEAPIVLLAGGRDKHLPWDAMAALAQCKARHIVLFGEAADLIDAALQEQSERVNNGRARAAIHKAGSLEGAVALAAKLAESGDVVLLSPGGTSFDAYPDFVARGEHFRQLVQELE